MTAKTVQELLLDVQELRAQADAIERAAIRTALEQSEWFVRRAARALGWHATALVRRLAMTGDLSELGREVASKRSAMGYRGGNPYMYVRTG